MVENASVTRSDDMRTLLNEVSHDLVRSDLENDEGIIVLPQVYPGGGAVVVRIRRDAQRYLVTDAGAGFIEAELWGGGLTFARIAPGVAEQHNVKFDSYAMFAVEVERGWLANAVIYVGSASRMAVERTAEKMAEEKEASLRHTLQERVREIFTSRASLNIAVIGSSTREWQFPAQAQLEDRLAVFDIVTPHLNSVAAGFTKFSDIADLTSPRVDGIAVASKTLDAADKILISKAARSVILLSDAPDVYLRAA